MLDVTWVITCMDSDKFRLMLRWLPEEPWPSIGRVEVITHRDRLDIVRECVAIGRIHRPRWPIHYRTDRIEEKHLDIIDAPEPLRVYFRDLLGVKLMIPLTIGTPMLFTDDDVIVTEDPSHTFGNMAWGSQSGLDAYTETAKDQAALDALASAYEINIPLHRFNQGRTDAGVWYLPHLDRVRYADLLCRYFSHDHTTEVSRDTGVAAGNHTQRFRKLDQRFLSGYMIYHGTAVRGPIYRALAEKNPPKSVPSATFLHYCASGRKEIYMDWLEREMPT